MTAPLFQLTGLLRQLALDALVTQSPIGKVKINALAKPADLTNAMRYTIKSQPTEHLQNELDMRLRQHYRLLFLSIQRLTKIPRASNFYPQANHFFWDTQKRNVLEST